MASTNQLPLALPYRTALDGDDFFVAPSNDAAVAWIDRWPGWPGGITLLCGPQGSGKSHLAAVWAARADAVTILVNTQAPALADNSLSLARNRKNIVLEQADVLTGTASETTFFHLINTIREVGGSLLLTARRPVGQWDTKLPDLSSRLRALPQVTLVEPDEALMAAVLVKLFNDRQLKVGAELITYLVPRLDRSFSALRSAVDSLGSSALAEGRAVTIPLARRVRGIYFG